MLERSRGHQVPPDDCTVEPRESLSDQWVSAIQSKGKVWLKVEASAHTHTDG